MGKITKSLCLKYLLSAAFLLCSTYIMADDSGLTNIELTNFITPQYNKKTHKLECIIKGKDATTVGSALKIRNAELSLISKDGKSIQAVITTPEALYDKATGFISGNKWIKLKSLAYDAQGVGFDASQITKTLHIRKKVKLIIKSTTEDQPSFDLGGNNKQKTGSEKNKTDKQQTPEKKNINTKINPENANNQKTEENK